MIGPFVLTLLLAAPAGASNAAVSSTPTDVASKALCTTLRENVRIALAGLMQNDAVIDTGRKAYRKMAEDRVARSPSVASDRLYVENAVSALVHNLARIDDLLDDSSRFPTAGVSPDALATNQMKQQLAAIADEQRKALNLLNGILETASFSDVANFDNGPGSPGSQSSLNSAPGEIDKQSATVDVTSAGAFDQVADDIAALQERAQTLESKAATTVLAVAAQCIDNAH
jgi:hypothetical protein